MNLDDSADIIRFMCAKDIEGAIVIALRDDGSLNQICFGDIGVLTAAGMIETARHEFHKKWDIEEYMEDEEE